MNDCVNVLGTIPSLDTVTLTLNEPDCATCVSVSPLADTNSSADTLSTSDCISTLYVAPSS